MNIRPATMDDVGAITEIYNSAILNTTATFDTEPKSMEQQRDWFSKHGSKYPVIVAEKSSSILGWASASLWSDRCAYAGTAENSVYIKSSARGMGVGTELLQALILESKRAGLHTLIARIVIGNNASIRLHEQCGFSRIGIMKEVGFKFGKTHDVLMMQILLQEKS